MNKSIFRGNVGTSTAFFLEAIKTCRLPAKIIGKLKLDFPQRRCDLHIKVKIINKMGDDNFMEKLENPNTCSTNTHFYDQAKIWRGAAHPWSADQQSEA